MTDSQVTRAYHIALISILTLVAYFNIFNHGFVWDDVDIIVDSPLFENFRNLPKFFVMEDSIEAATGYYRPLTYVSFMIDRLLWGLNPLGFNITNLVLHIGTAVAFYLLVFELFRKEQFALFAGLIFALHPIANETVNFHAGGRNTLLCALFGLLSMLFHVKGKYFTATVCLALACFSKEFALLLPAVFLLCDSYILKRKLILKNYLYYLAVVILYLSLRTYAVSQPNFIKQFDFYNLLLLSPKIVINYLINMVYPLNLKTMYHIMPADRVRQMMPYILAILVIITTSVLIRKRRELLLATVWFFLFLLPVMGLLDTGLANMADRYAYFSSMGFAMALAYIICLAPRKLAVIILAPICICYAGINIQRNLYWKDQLSLFTQMVKDAPDLPTGYQNLGYLFYEKGEMDKAVDYLSIAYTKQALNPKLLFGSATILWEAKQYDKAIIALTKRNQLEPNDPIAYILMSKIYGEKGDAGNEKLYRDKAEKISPHVNEMIQQRVESLCLDMDEQLEKHDLAGAERLLKEAQKIDPNAVPVLVDAGVLAAEKGDLKKSLEYLTKALKLNPLYPPVHYNLSIVYQMMGNKSESDKEMALFKKADVQPEQSKSKAPTK